jgi:hypothetical protein
VPAEDASEAAPRLELRCAAYFNPEAFASQRRLAAKTLAEIDSEVGSINAQLKQTMGRTNAESVRRKVDRLLRSRNLVSAFQIQVRQTTIAGSAAFQVELALCEAEWQRRRRFDGFTVIVADPRVQMSARQLCRTYRAKDAVETDFQVIKSLIKLRPVRHRTDLKVRAHVTLCMLALLVQRTVHQALSPKKISAQLAFELLEPCRLMAHQATGRSRPTYVLTHPSDEQVRILRRLGLARLVDVHEVAGLTPRGAFVPTGADETAQK